MQYLGLAALALLTVFINTRVKKLLDKNYNRANSNFEKTKAGYNELARENEELKKISSDLQKKIEDIIALYDITKDICASLDEEKIFGAFKNRANKYLSATDCRFLKNKEDLPKYKNYSVMPLEINKAPAGYLAVSGVKEQDKERFYILAQQFLLGIKRAFLYQKVQELSVTDSLTEVLSRRFFLEKFDEELKRSKKLKYNLSFLMLDIDWFKKYNDTYGHLVGDAILKEICRCIKENLRQIDLIGRYGGEEFSIALSETNKEQAKFAAQRIRQAIETKNIKAYDEELRITVSIGISTFPDDAPDMQTLIDKADMALYQAKETGRNKICAYAD